MNKLSFSNHLNSVFKKQENPSINKIKRVQLTFRVYSSSLPTSEQLKGFLESGNKKIYSGPAAIIKHQRVLYLPIPIISQLVLAGKNMVKDF